MARRRRPEKREILPDPRFGDTVLTKFMNLVMYQGKKSTAERIVYGALDTIEGRMKTDPIGVFHEALNNVKPAVEVRSRRRGGCGPRRAGPRSSAPGGTPRRRARRSGPR